MLNAFTSPEVDLRSRGYLTHLTVPAGLYSITWCLADAWPERAPQEQYLSLTPAARRAMNQTLDRGYGSCVLREPRIADLLEGVLRHFDGERYDLFGWVLMPNHVHALAAPRGEWTLSRILQNWKGFSAHTINQELGRSGRLWQPESYTRVIRNREHFRMCLEYIHGNPARAALCSTPEEWRWTSARLWASGELTTRARV